MRGGKRCYIANITDILENGPAGESSGGFFTGRRGRFVIGAFVVALLVVTAVNAVRQARGPTPTPIRAGLVETGTGYAYQSSPVTKDFVLQVELTNFNHAPVQVQAAETPEHPGFDRLVVAVLPGHYDSQAPAGEALEKAARTPTMLGWEEPAQLAIAGRVACGTPMISHDEMTILVNGQERTVAIPRIVEGRSWAEEIRRELC
ncbi:hypothetical protein [Actinoplanes sp. NPDC049118]|uniref:hypothetical protein n=1 Tax=Actinoplanes sp. NPDC049118 TaxID=3155769 RepID=UPI0033EF7DC6